MNNNKYKCDFCDKIFSSRQSKCNHTHIKHKDQLINKVNNNNCKYCNKTFTTQAKLNRHNKTNCKNINTTNNININIINNIINIQNINSYCKPCIDSFNLLDICNIFDEEFNMILKLIEITYFNDKIEENHSFYVSNLHGIYVNTYSCQESNTKLKKYFFDELFTMILNRIKLLYSKYKNKLFEIPKQVEIQEKIQALEDMKKENNHTYKSYLKLINVLAYDKKDLIINTWTKLKQLESCDPNTDFDIIWDRNITL